MSNFEPNSYILLEKRMVQIKTWRGLSEMAPHLQEFFGTRF